MRPAKHSAKTKRHATARSFASLHLFDNYLYKTTVNMGAPDLQSSQASDPEAMSPAPLDPEGANAGGGSGIPSWRRYVILFIVSWNCHVVVATSTSVLVASPEISAELHTTPTIINITNSGVLLMMGISSWIWVPLGDWLTRRISYSLSVLLLFVTSIGTAVSHNFATFTAMRLLTGLTGTYFMVAGQTIIADIFGPLVRGRAVGCMMVGSVAGGALGMVAIFPGPGPTAFSHTNTQI